MEEFDIGGYGEEPEKKSTHKEEKSEVDKLEAYYKISIKKILDFRLMLLTNSGGLGVNFDYKVRLGELSVSYDLYIDDELICESFCKLINELYEGVEFKVKINEDYIIFDFTLFYRELIKEILKWKRNSQK